MQMGQTMYNAMLSDMGLNLKNEPEKRVEVLKPVARAACPGPAAGRRARKRHLHVTQPAQAPPPEKKSSKKIWIVTIVVARRCCCSLFVAAVIGSRTVLVFQVGQVLNSLSSSKAFNPLCRVRYKSTS